jgi:DnaB helicase-like protein/AAA domain-containing protein
VKAAESASRIPPHHLDAERAVLGAILLEGRETLPRVIELLKPSDFYTDAHRLTYQAMLTLFDRGEPVDVLTLTEELRRGEHLQLVGGPAALALLVEQGSISAYLSSYTSIVREYGDKRDALARTLRIAEHLQNGHGPGELLAEVEGLVGLLRTGTGRRPEPELIETVDGYIVTWLPTEAAVRFEALRDDHHDGQTADVTLFAGEQLLTFGRIGLASAQARATLLRSVERPAPFATWAQLVQTACYLVVERLKAGTPPVVLVAAPPAPARFLIRDAVPADDVTLQYGPSGAGKSLTALLMAMASGRTLAGFTPTRAVKVGVLDWESNEHTHGGRLWGLAKGLEIDPPEIVYFHMDRPLVDEVRRLGRECRRLRLEALVIDSAAYACDGPPEESQSATRFFTALRSLHVTAVVIAHMSKAAIEAAEGKPFGSIYWENAPRLTWELRPDGQRPTAAIVKRQVGLYNRKSNAEYFPDRALEFQIDTATTIITPTALAMESADPGLVTRGLNQGQLVLRTIDNKGPMDAKALNAATGISADVLYEVCKRLVDRSLLTRVPNAKPVQWARASARKSTC